MLRDKGDKDQTIILKTDQEPAIKFLVDDVCMARTGAKTIVKEAPVASKGSNGVVESAVQTAEQYVRTLKSLRMKDMAPASTRGIQSYLGLVITVCTCSTGWRCPMMGRQPTKDAKENELKSSALSSGRESCGSTGRLGHIRAS